MIGKDDGLRLLRQMLLIRRYEEKCAELYQAEKNNLETLEKFGRGTPDDRLERNVYLRYPNAGIITLVIANLLLFGVPGIILIAVQLASMPVFAAGIINGLGHYSGYRNFECDDAATNLVPWGILIGGEELHNNHHAFPTSAKFSVRRWEFDIGWMYICILRAMGLAKVRKVAPRPVLLEKPALQVDLENLRAVIVNRMHVLRDYTRQVTLPVLRSESAAAASRDMLRRARKLLVRQPKLLDERAHERLGDILARHQALATVHRFRERLSELWNGTHLSNERLLEKLQQWCAEAEASGIEALEEFAARLRAYRLSPA